jgi:hypothetical protein
MSALLAARNTYWKEFPAELIPQVEEAVKGDDWTFGGGVFEGEQYLHGRRQQWLPGSEIYVRGDTALFLKFLRECDRNEDGTKDVPIELGSQTGPHYRQWAFDKVVGIAKMIGTVVPGVTDLKVWYDDRHDFTCCSFRVDGSSYSVRHYKVLVATKDGQDDFLKDRRFHTYEHKLIDFFRTGKHRQWIV